MATQYAEFGSTPLASDQVTDQDVVDSIPNQVVRGARAGTYGMGSSLRNAAAALGDSLGADEFAASQYAEADRLAQRAREVGPRVGSLEQLGREGYTLRNMGDYAAGVIGGAAPSIGVGVGAALATGGAALPALAAGTAAFTPFETGDAVAKWRAANPGQQIDGETMARLGATGAGSAAFQSVVPAALGGKIMGRGVASAPSQTLRQAMGRNVAGIPMEGATEGAGEFIKQRGATPELDTDWASIGENALAGAIGGAPMAGVGAGADYLHGRGDQISGAARAAGGAVTDAARSAADAVRGAGAAAADAGSSLAQAPTEVAKDAWSSITEIAQSAAKGLADSELGKTINERVGSARAKAEALINDPQTPDMVRERLQAMGDKVGTAANRAMVWAADKYRAGAQAVETMRTDAAPSRSAGDVLRSLRAKPDDTVDKVISGDYLGNPAEIATATDEQILQRTAASDERATSTARTWGEELLAKASLSPERRARVEQAMANLGEQASRATVASIKKVEDTADALRSRISAFRERLGGKDEAAGKKSADYSGAEQAIGDVLARYRGEIPNEVMTDPDLSRDLAGAMRRYMAVLADTKGEFDTIDKHWTRAQLGSLLGPRATDIIGDLAEAVGPKNPEAREQLYARIQELQAGHEQDQSLVQAMTDALPEGTSDAARSRVPEEAQALMSWARGELTQGKGAAETKVIDNQFQALLAEKFGPKAKAVLKALEAQATVDQDMRLGKVDGDRRPASSDDAADAVVDPYGSGVSIREDDDAAPNRSYYGSGKSRRILVENPEVHDARNPAFAGRSTAAELIKQLKTENPGADVRFVSIVDDPSILERVPSEKKALTEARKKMTPEQLEAYRAERIAKLKTEGKGMISVSELAGPDKLTRDEVDAMRMDTEAFGAADNPARLVIQRKGKDGTPETDAVFDAVAMTRTMTKKINREGGWTAEDDRSQGHRMLRAFSDAMAALSDGVTPGQQRFSVKTSTVIGTIDGKPFTLGEARALAKDAGKNFSDDRQDRDGRAAHQRRRHSLPDERSTSELRTAVNGLETQIGKLEKALEASDDDAFVRQVETQLEDLRGTLEKTQELFERRYTADAAQDAATARGQQDIGKDDQIASAAAVLSEQDLQHRVNMDGTVIQTGAQVTPASRAETLNAKIRRLEDGTRPGTGSDGRPAQFVSRPARAIGAKARLLFDNFTAMTPSDRMRFAALTDSRAASDMAGVVNALHEKYQPVIEAAARPFYPLRSVPLAKNIKAYTDAAIEQEAATAEKQRLLAEANDPGGDGPAWEGPMEGSPDPKARAAKQAAFLERAASGDAALIAELSASNDAKGLQRALQALGGVEPTRENSAGITAAFEAAAERLHELARDPDVAYGLATRRYSLDQSGRPGPQANEQAVREYLHRVLGDSVAVEFAGILHAGDFTRDVNGDVIRISVHSLDPLSVAYHESLHAFFQQLKDKGLREPAGVVRVAAMSPVVQAQLKKLLAHSPDALAQLKDPEESAAYMYQFWQAGQLQLTAKPEGVLQRIAAAFRAVLGHWTYQQHAQAIMTFFSSGQYAQKMSNPSAVAAALAPPKQHAAAKALQGAAKPLISLGNAVASAGSSRLRESRIPALATLADKVKPQLTEDTGDAGFIPAARQAYTTALNRLGQALAPYDKETLAQALEQLQTGVPAASTSARTAAFIVKKELGKQMRYMQGAGVDLGDLGPDYFPRVYDPSYISQHQQEFMAVLAKHGVGEETMHRIVSDQGTDIGIEVDRPGAQHARMRKLAQIPDAELAPFMQKDLYQILNNYYQQSARRAEWARRFGDDSKVYHDLLAQAKLDGATPEQVETARKFVLGVNGTLGDGINPTARRLMGDMIVYQNIRLLPLAIFSSLIDPMGILVRGGEISDAWGAFKRGIREIPKGLKGDSSLDASAAVADLLGVIENAALVNDLGTAYSQGMGGNFSRKLNDKFFRYNLMEQFNRSMRVGATEAALKFIVKHSTGKASAHSARWMNELGLRKSDVVMVGDRMALTQADGLTAQQEARVRMAVNKWVDGAILRPDAADKPIWMNDPHFMLLSHLKQFVYAFHHTILKRVMHEARNANFAPAMALGAYVPLMIASDMLKGALQTGGDEPEWKKNWGVADYVAQGVQRAGLLGVGQFGVDALQNVERGGTGVGALMGPSIEQLGDMVQVIGGRKEFDDFLLRSMPANAVYAEAVS